MNWSLVWAMASQYAILIAGKIIAALVILVIGFKLANFLVKFIANRSAFTKLEPGVQSFLKSFLSIALKVLVIVTAAGMLGIQMASFITILGSVAVAVGLSLQGSLSNIAGGILILSLKNFTVGDVITAAGNTGKVTDIGMFYTYLETEDGKKIILPNSVVSNQPVINAKNQ